MWRSHIYPVRVIHKRRGHEANDELKRFTMGHLEEYTRDETLQLLLGQVCIEKMTDSTITFSIKTNQRVTASIGKDSWTKHGVLIEKFALSLQHQTGWSYTKVEDWCETEYSGGDQFSLTNRLLEHFDLPDSESEILLLFIFFAPFGDEAFEMLQHWAQENDQEEIYNDLITAWDNSQEANASEASFSS